VADRAVSSAIDEAIANAGARNPAQVAGTAHEQHSHHGRTSSWVAITIIVIGFVVGGAAMLTSPVTWWLFWVGAGIVVVGGIMALSTRVLDDWY
jgi:hypothetical protein